MRSTKPFVRSGNSGLGGLGEQDCENSRNARPGCLYSGAAPWAGASSASRDPPQEVERKVLLGGLPTAGVPSQNGGTATEGTAN